MPEPAMTADAIEAEAAQKKHAYDAGTFLVVVPESAGAPNGEYKHRLTLEKAEVTAAELKRRGKKSVQIIAIGGTPPPTP